MNKDLDLSGKNCIVTGAAGLMGVQHVEALIEAGAFVFLADINFEMAQKTSRRFCGQACALHLDVTRESHVSQALQMVLNERGTIDVLINNAAIDPKANAIGLENSTRFEHFSLDTWNFELGVGLTGAFLCSKIFGSWMAANEGGIILNISSDLSVIAPDQRIYMKQGLSKNEQAVKPVTYSVIKTGIIGLTRYLAAYWAEDNVRVNALSPGGIFNNQNPEFVKRLTGLIPMGRMASEDEYQGAVRFLCSDASKYMTGQNIIMDGGRSII